MKKIIRGIGKFFRAIYSFFDKIIITPITKLVLKIVDSFKENSHNLEKVLNKKSSLIIISLFLACAVFFIFDQENNLVTDQYAETLYNQTITADFDDAYVVEGLPEAVDVTLIGQKRHIFLAKQSPNKEVIADLTGLTPGQHKITLKYTQNITSLDYKLSPSTVTVMIYDKVSENRELSVDILHRNHLDSKLNIENGNVKLSRSEVIIKGAEYKLKEVASVKALVDVDNLSNPKVETVTLKEVPLVAYDSKGNIIDVEIVPKTVEAKITITSPSKEVPIEIVPSGKVAFGKSIKSTVASVDHVTIYGKQEVLDKIESIPVKVNVKGLTQDKEFNVNIKADGVRDISVKTITVKVTLDSETSKEYNGIGITTENLNSKFKVQALSEEDSRVSVVVKGSKSILDSFDPSTIKAVIDLKKYDKAGEYSADVKVTGGDLRLSYEAKTKKVKIRIVEK